MGTPGPVVAAPSGTVYDPDTDDVVQAELAAETAAAADREAVVREAQRITARADELQALCELPALEQTEPPTGTKPRATSRPGEPADTSRPTSPPGSPAPWPRTSGTTRDPAARKAAAGLLPPPTLAHAALLAELVRLVPGVDMDQLAFAVRLATTEPEATGVPSHRTLTDLTEV